MWWIQLFIMLLTYLSRKKAGDSSAQAGALALGAGFATHYVANNTQWGADLIGGANATIDGWFGIGQGNVDDGVVTDGEGNPVAVPPGTTPVKQPDGSVIFVPNKGGATTTTAWGSTIPDLLKSWGPEGTSLVIGTTAASTSSSLRKWLPWIAGGFLLVGVLK